VPYVVADPPELEELTMEIETPPAIVILVENWHLTS
jgi:hypothetical protein